MKSKGGGGGGAGSGRKVVYISREKGEWESGTRGCKRQQKREKKHVYVRERERKKGGERERQWWFTRNSSRSCLNRVLDPHT